VELNKPASGPATGGATLAARVAGTDLDFSLTIPEQVIVGLIRPGDRDLGQLTEYVMGAPAPGWLAGIKLNEVRLELDWRNHQFTLAAMLATDIDLPVQGRLVEASVTAEVSSGRRSVCVRAGWIPAAGGPGIEGEICYPFDQFRTQDGQ